MSAGQRSRTSPEQHDAHALAHDEGLDGYAITGLDDVLLEAMAEDAVPPWVRKASASRRPTWW